MPDARVSGGAEHLELARGRMSVEYQSLEFFLVPVSPVLFLGSFVAVGEPPASMVQGVYWKLLSS